MNFIDNPDYRRAKLIALTDPGRNVFDRVSRAQAQWSNNVAKAFAPVERHRAIEVTQKLSEKI